jgi:siroheme decarboxylase
MSNSADSIDKSILNSIQQEIPLTRRPFLEIAARIGISELETLKRIERLSGPSPQIIRQISAIFDSRLLGYKSTLVASKIPEPFLDKAVSVINAHPGVSHNYLRNHDYNLWYTLAVSPNSFLGLEKTVQILHHRSGSLVTRMFPTLKLFKIGVKFDFGVSDSEPAETAPGDAVVAPLTEDEKRKVRILQNNLPLDPMPFDVLAKEGDMDPDELIAAACGFKRQKRMRRFAAVLRHRNAGFLANAMGVWAVPEDRIESFGAMAAAVGAVSHCYQRPTFEDWPYSVFTMIHGKTDEDCQEVIRQLAEKSGVDHHAALYSTREFKKIRVKYFEPDIANWEAANHD